MTTCFNCGFLGSTEHFPEVRWVKVFNWVFKRFCNEQCVEQIIEKGWEIKTEEEYDRSYPQVL